METPNLKTVKIGTKETPKLTAKDCIVQNVDTVFVEKAKNNKAVFSLKHPDADEPLNVSSAVIMRERKDKKEIVSSGTWMSLDIDNQLDKNSATSHVLRTYGATSLIEMIGKSVKTEVDSSGYLAIKAY